MMVTVVYNSSLLSDADLTHFELFWLSNMYSDQEVRTKGQLVFVFLERRREGRLTM